MEKDDRRGEAALTTRTAGRMNDTDTGSSELVAACRHGRFAAALNAFLRVLCGSVAENRLGALRGCDDLRALGGPSATRE